LISSTEIEVIVVVRSSVQLYSRVILALNQQIGRMIRSHCSFSFLSSSVQV